MKQVIFFTKCGKVHLCLLSFHKPKPFSQMGLETGLWVYHNNNLKLEWQALLDESDKV